MDQRLQTVWPGWETMRFIGCFSRCPALTDVYYPGSEEEAAANGGFGDLAALHIHYDADGAQPERTEP